MLTCNRNRNSISFTGCRGASLVEVLVSMLILAGGILGMFALQTSSMKSNQNSYMRVLANTYALDIVERMRANAQGALNNSYNNPTATLNSDCMSDNGCSSSQMAGHDVAQWQAEVAANLPMGAATICLDSTPDDGTVLVPACDSSGNVFAVKIWWDADRSGAASRNYMMSFSP